MDRIEPTWQKLLGEVEMSKTLGLGDSISEPR
jgi:hypothetical protein